MASNRWIPLAKIKYPTIVATTDNTRSAIPLLLLEEDDVGASSVFLPPSNSDGSGEKARI